MSQLGIISSFHLAHDSFLSVIDDSYCSDIGKMIWSYCGWLRNPAPPKGWLKPYKSWDKPSIRIYQLVQHFLHQQ